MSILALVDCNNFYVSCERLFQPKLEGRPVVVLSNNDGCVVARSQEVKDLGVKMGVPWFQLLDLARKHDIIALSSNYTLYADLSNRVMRVLAQFSSRQEVYSIDECFLDLTENPGDVVEYGQQIRRTVRQWLGLPVCIGIGSTKTLAKLANHLAKKRYEYEGVCNLNALPAADAHRLFSTIDVGEVWGVGPRITARLVEMAIHTVEDLRRAPAKPLRACFGVVLERTIAELNGVSCIALEEHAPAKQQLMVSRSFGRAVSTRTELEQAIATYMSRAAEKLRRQAAVASVVSVFIRTNPFKPNEPQYQNSLTVAVPEPTADTRLLVRTAQAALRRLYRAGFAYQKAGVMLSELRPAALYQATLFGQESPHHRSAALMAAWDRVNAKWGSSALRLLGEGTHTRWRMRRSRMTPRYTTHLEEVAEAVAK